MKEWQTHWLEASGDLSQQRGDITDGLSHVYRALVDWGEIPHLDILIRKNGALSGGELAVSGFSYGPALFEISLDPEAEHEPARLRSEVARTALHEIHHCLRMRGPGYGETLGEALVTEGLAGQFVRHLLATEPEPWESALHRDALRSSAVRAETLASYEYSHPEWFFGRGELPNWFGYSLGYQMVESWLRTVPPIDRSSWINVDAEEVIDAAIKDGLIQG